MSRLFFRLGTALFSLCVLCATAESHAVVIRDDVADSEYKDFASQFSSVGRIYAGREDGLLDVGSGTLIGTRWVLTAAHVVDGIRPSLSFKVGGIVYAAQPTSIAVFPGYLENQDAFSDIAVFRLDAVPPIQPAFILDTAVTAGKPVAITGYGLTGVGSKGYDYKMPLGVQRAGTNVVDQVTEKGRILLADFDAPDGYIYHGGDSPFTDGVPTALEAQHGGGDSGGGWFVSSRGTWALAGVVEGTVSYAGTKGGYYGDIAQAVAVKPYTSWLSSLGIDYRYINAVPEPSPIALFFAAFLAVGFFHRRAKWRIRSTKHVLLVIGVGFLLSGCGRTVPNISMTAMTMFDKPVTISFTNEGRSPVTIQRALVNDTTPLNRALMPARTFEPTTLAQGESVTFDNNLSGPINQISVFTEQGEKHWDLRE